MALLACQKVRFGPFELDPASGELFKLGHKMNLRGQPIEVLSILLERPGEVVRREELCKRLWPQDTFVDFEHSLNTDIKKLRQALDDDADTPRYIETLPKKGYRFVAPINFVSDSVQVSQASLQSAESTTEVRQPTRKRWWWPVVALLLMAIVGAAAYWFLRPRTPVVTGVHQLTRTGHPKQTLYGVHQVATDGTRLYFNDWTNAGPQHIAQISVKGGDISYLETPSLNVPALAGSSTDGSELLLIDLSSDRYGSFPWLASPANGSLRKLGDMHVAYASLVPRSTQFVYTDTTNLKQLFAADMQNGRSRRILNAPREIYLFAISPDGKRIRFEMPNQLWESTMDGSTMHRFLSEQTAQVCCGAWSRDGKLFVFAREDQGVRNLWGVRETDWLGRKRASQPIQLTNGPISFSTPVFSREGDKMFALGIVPRGELSVYDGAPGKFSPYLGGISAGYVDFSRDGQWVAYVAHPQGTLWVSRMDGSERLQLTYPPMGPVMNPKWSPDGRLVAFTEWRYPERKVYLVSAKGGSPLLLLSGDFKPNDPTWSPDGKSIAYSGVSIDDGTGTEVRILNLETKQSTTVPGSQRMFSARWSPDGRYLVAISDDYIKLFLYEFGSGRWKELPAASVPGWPSWSNDSRYLFVASDRAIYRYAIPDGRPELVADPAGVALTCPILYGVWSFSLTPDDRILVLRDRGSDELYALALEYR